MSIATVVTRGFGAFGSVNLLPTLGFTAGAEIGPGICAAASGYVAGANSASVHLAGAFAGGVFVPLPTVLGGYVPGACDGDVFVAGPTYGHY